MKNVPRTVVAIVSLCLVLLVVPQAHATSLVKMNIADLTSLSNLILVGRVVSVSDGFDSKGLPYTDVTIKVGEAIRGNVSGNYTFRQFGLLEPRDMGDGRIYLGVSPDGWPRFAVTQEVVVFLYETTALGFQSTVGLLQGKFDVVDGRVRNAIDNQGLFANVAIDPAVLSEAEQKMLTVKRGSVHTETFVSFVSKAVQHNWFE